MSWLSGDWVSGTTRLRSALRRAGVTRCLSALRPLLGATAYEERVDRALSSLLRTGDCVWDVGANVGFYTERFANAVGLEGAVVAFEPVASTHRVLKERIRGFKQVQTLQVALGAKHGTVTLALDDDPTSPTNSLINTSLSSTGPTQTVTVVSGDEMVANGSVPAPSVIKIDTEGFEEDVVWGMRDLLRSPRLRAVLIEVHFAILERRGFRSAPARLYSLLDDAGFRLRWVDASHLLATRNE